MRLPPLNPLRAFEAAARCESFTRAAEELYVTQGAVSRQVKALEEHFGFTLFDRTPTGVVLSLSGRAFAAALTDAFAAVAQAADELVLARTHTVLTIRGYTTFLVRWLIPVLGAFQACHRNIEVRLEAAADPVDFHRHAADIGILYGHGAWPGLDADLLFQDELFPVCSPALREGETPLRRPEDLANHTLLHLNQRRRDWPAWLSAAGCPEITAGADFFLEDLSVVYQCAIEGMGVAIGQRAYLREELASGRLVVPFDTVLRRRAGYFLVCPTDRADVTKIRVFRDWLRERLAAPP
ncbi:MAG: transcriptional regulator GcvA [Acetobacteraceae bacterium]